MRGSDIEFFNGYRARDDSGISEENAALRSKQSLPVADRCESVFEMQDRVDANDDIERPVRVGKPLTAIGNFEPGQLRKALRDGLLASALDTGGFDIHPKEIMANLVEPCRSESANWVRDIQSQPQVKVRVGDAEFNAFARVVNNDREPQLAATVKALFVAKYGWSDGLIVELTPA